jgi:hypothetical protein
VTIGAKQSTMRCTLNKSFTVITESNRHLLRSLDDIVEEVRYDVDNNIADDVTDVVLVIDCIDVICPKQKYSF